VRYPEYLSQVHCTFTRLHSGYHGYSSQSVFYQYTMKSKILTLYGLQNELQFTLHTNNIVSRAHSRANLKHKGFVSKDCESLLCTYTTYVRPLLEYAHRLGQLILVTDIIKLEAVQRRFTKSLRVMQNMDYLSRIETLAIDSLKMRRLHADLIFAFNILFGLYDMLFV